MTEEQLKEACEIVGKATLELYAGCCEVSPKAIVITGMTVGLVACAVEAGVSRESVLAAINSVFDDIEKGPTA